MTVLYTLAETLRQIALLLYPFMPRTSTLMRQQLGLSSREEAPQWAEELTWGGIGTGRQIQKGPSLFPRIETEKTKAAPAVKTPTEPLSSPVPSLTFEEFQKWELRVAKILKAERVPKSKKLVKLTVDLGDIRTVVAGIGQDYTPEDLLGKAIVVVANLEPTKLMGVESQAMLLAARDENGLKLIVPEGEIVPGTKVK
jgi:methionyl-tRNA synthetase